VIADAGDEQIERPDRAATDLEADVRQLARQCARIRREGQHHQLIEHEADADGREQRCDAHRVLERPQAEPLDDQPDQRGGDRDDDDGERQRRMQLHHRDPADIGADQIDRALRKVDQPADAEDQREPDRNERRRHYRRSAR
jgi:hypothetical protein